MLDRLSIFAEALDTTVEFILSGNKHEGRYLWLIEVAKEKINGKLVHK